MGLRAKEVAALAIAPGGDRLAIGDAQGALIGTPGQAFRRVLHRGPVLDLAYLADGALLAATGRGLYRIDRDGGSAQLAPGPGAAARAVRRIASVPGLTALATGDGLFVSPDARAWRRLAGALPSGEASAVALHRHGDIVACWAVVRGELWRVDLGPAGPDARDGQDRAPATVVAASRAVLPAATLDGGAVDIAIGLPQADLVVIFPQALAVLRSDAAPERWEILRPELPPGARALRLGSGAGRFWLATDRGLLEAAQLSGPWRRTSPPAGTSAIGAAVGAGDVLFAAASDGVLAGVPAPPPAPSTAPAVLAPLGTDPPIALVHRAALGYLGLHPSRMEALRRGARRRAWWPIVGVRGSAEWDHSRNTDRDQAFLSGDTRHLIDRAFDSGDAFEVSLTLSWDLGGVAYEPESVDVSRETREVIELRDDVLDEITQLYFERRGVLASLAAADPKPAGETQRLRLRADELAAGIDAWTGGWFGRQVPALAP